MSCKHNKSVECGKQTGFNMCRINWHKHHIFVGHCIRVGSIDLPTPDYIILMIMIQMQGTCRNGFYRALVFDIPGVLPLDVSVMLRVY